MIKLRSFEEFFEGFIKSKPKELNELFEKTKEKIGSYSMEETFSAGKEYLKEENYLEAMAVFYELSKKEDKTMKELARLYNPLIFAIRFDSHLPEITKIFLMIYL